MNPRILIAIINAVFVMGVDAAKVVKPAAASTLAGETEMNKVGSSIYSD